MFIQYALTTTTSQTYPLPIEVAARAVFSFTSSAVTLAAANTLVITHDTTPAPGTTFHVLWDCQYSLGSGASIQIFGKVIAVAGDWPSTYASTKLNIIAVYNGTTYDVYATPTSAVDIGLFMAGSLDEGAIFLGSSTDVPTTLDVSTSGNILVGNGTTLVSVAMSGDIAISAAGETTIQANSVALSMLEDYGARGQIVVGGVAGAPQYLSLGTTGKFLVSDGTDPAWVAMSGDVVIDATGAATIQTGAVEVSMVEDDLKYEVLTFPVSFEAAGGVVPSVGDFKIKMPYPGTVTEIYAYATKAIAGTDNATIVPKDNGGTTMTAGTVTFTASDARGTAYTTTPTANNTFVAGDILTFTTAKTTAGGHALVSVKVTRS